MFQQLFYAIRCEVFFQCNNACGWKTRKAYARHHLGYKPN